MLRKIGSKTVVFCWMMLETMTGCENKKDEIPLFDTPLQGSINISVDESFKPVIEEQLKVYKASYPETDIKATYKPEAECLEDLLYDSVRMVIVSRGLTEEEAQSFTKRLYFKPQYDVVAYDAITAIINTEETDSVFSFKRLEALLTGRDSSLKVVMDGKVATSTVRYLYDSLTNKKGFGSNTEAADGSDGVTNYIANHTGAIGFVGSSWVTDYQDPKQKKLHEKLKLALLECKVCKKGTYAKAAQVSIAYNQYPLVRPLYFILKENRTGLGTGFTNYLSLERGQLVFRRSGLVPSKMQFGIRKTMIEEK